MKIRKDDVGVLPHNCFVSFSFTRVSPLLSRTKCGKIHCDGCTRRCVIPYIHTQESWYIIIKVVSSLYALAPNRQSALPPSYLLSHTPSEPVKTLHAGQPDLAGAIPIVLASRSICQGFIGGRISATGTSAERGDHDHDYVHMHIKVRTSMYCLLSTVWPRTKRLLLITFRARMGTGACRAFC